MIHLTTDAMKIRETYLEQVRTYVDMSKTADTNEVIRDVNEHIDRELQNLTQPVSKEDMESILERLGSPRQWLNEDDLTWWRKMTMRLRKGPEDWRLAYLAFATLVIGTVLMGPIGLFASFCLSRATLSVSEKNELQAKRWLVFPSLLIVYFLIAPILLFWPVIPLIGICATSFEVIFEKSFNMLCVSVFTSIIAIGMAIWWGFLWLLTRKYVHLAKILFKPFAENWKLNWLGYLSIVLFLIGSCAIVFVIRNTVHVSQVILVR